MERTKAVESLQTVKCHIIYVDRYSANQIHWRLSMSPLRPWGNGNGRWTTNRMCDCKCDGRKRKKNMKKWHRMHPWIEKRDWEMTTKNSWEVDLRTDWLLHFCTSVNELYFPRIDWPSPGVCKKTIMLVVMFCKSGSIALYNEFMISHNNNVMLWEKNAQISNPSM